MMPAQQAAPRMGRTEHYKEVAMEWIPGVHGRARVPQGNSAHGAVLLALLMALLLAAGSGCGGRRHESKSAATRRGSDTTSTAGAARKSAKSGASEAAAPRESKSVGPANHVRLIQRGCVEFEPHWTTIRVGQPLTWHSDLKVSVTLHVPAGAFDRTEYVLRPGQNLSTGPARNRGTYPIWTDPAACQGIARGVQGSGPGVTVEGEPTR
jgi:plastocyanin